jgi:hypothetical protein
MKLTTKLVRIVCSRPLKEVPVEVGPDDTASDVLEKAGLNAGDYMLMKPGDTADFEPIEPVFHEVEDGGKLHVVPHSTVGALRWA